MIPRFYLLLCLFLALSLPSFSQAKRVGSTSEVLQWWKPDQHLYVRGQLPVTDKALDELEAWLDVHGKNWTVVLLRNANGESWKDERGTSYKGMDAVENILGRGLGNLPEFSALRDVQTGERNGAVFVIFLKERKFSYFASDVFDKRRLGEDEWINYLDGPAIDAMRGGGRIIDAVKDTVSSIESKLKDRIAGERVSEEERKRRSQRQLKYFKDLADSLLLRINVHEKKIESLRLDSLAEGILANEQHETRRRAVRDVIELLDEGVRDGVELELQIVESWIAKRENELDIWRRDLPEMKERLEELQELEIAVDYKGGDRIRKAAISVFEEAIQKHSMADMAYIEDYAYAQKIRRELLERNTYLRERREARLLGERQRAKRLRRNNIIAGSVVAGVLLLIAVFSNFRRRKLKKRAEELILDWREKLKLRSKRLFRVLDVATLRIGTESDLIEQKVVGRTLEESIKAIRGIDYAFVLSASTDHVLSQAEGRVFPKKGLRWLWNLVSRDNYLMAIERLEKFPITIKPGTDRTAALGDRGLLGETIANTKFSYTFEELIRKFDQTLDMAEQRIELVYQAWNTVLGKSQQLDVDLLGVQQKVGVVDGHYQKDAWFGCAPLAQSWYPAARSLHVEALQLSSNDPLRALETSLLRGQQMADEMNLLLQGIIDYREHAMGSMIELHKGMYSAGRNTRWMDEAVDGFSEEVLDIMEAGSQSSVHSEIEGCLASLQEFCERVVLAADVVESANTKFVEIKKRTEDDVASAREYISSQLNLPERDVLNEEGMNPSKVIELAVKHQQEAISMVDTGRAEVAEESLSKACGLLEDASSIVSHTREAYEEFAGRLLRGRQAEVVTNKLLEEMRVTLTDLDKVYLPSALLFDVNAVDGEGYQQAVKRSGDEFKILRKSLDLAPGLFKESHILEAQEALIVVEEVAEQLEKLHAGLHHRRDDLLEVEGENREVLAECRTHLDGYIDSINEHAVEHSTQNQYRELCDRWQVAEEQVNAGDGQRSPYHVQHLLRQIIEDAERLDREVEADREDHNQAVRSQEAAEVLYREAINVVDQSRYDNIVDSQKTKQSVNSIESQVSKLERTREKLGVAHSKWNEISKDIGRIENRLVKDIQDLREELEQGQRAKAALEESRDAVERAMDWSGSYGVRVSGDYGSSELNLAVQSLMRGHYSMAIQMAGKAERSASQAIARAESHVASLKRARNARKAEALRRREERGSFFESFGTGYSGSYSSSSSRSRSSSSRSSGSSSTRRSSSGSSGSSGFSRSSSSSGSGFSRSSSSSGSGFSRSGW